MSNSLASCTHYTHQLECKLFVDDWHRCIIIMFGRTLMHIGKRTLLQFNVARHIPLQALYSTPSGIHTKPVEKCGPCVHTQSLSSACLDA